MKFGVGLFPLRPAQIVDVTCAAEELGYDSVWLGEHVVTPVARNSTFPYADDDAHEAFHPHLPFLDPYATLGYLAAKTQTIRLAVSVSIVPLHDPFRLARQIATMDILSGGRFDFGIGSGWMEEEFEVLGKDFTRRGKILDETLDVLDLLFSESVTSYDGDIFQVPPVAMEPKPITLPHPPYVFGGMAPRALRRAARRGQGWLASGVGPDTIRFAVELIMAERDRLGLTDPFEISAHVNGEIDPDLPSRYEAAGVTRLVIRPWTKGRHAVDAITRAASSLGIDG